MANKQLTASVRINSKQAEQKLRNIAKSIDAINRACGRTTTAFNQVDSTLRRANTGITRSKSETDKLANSANKVSNNFKKSNNSLRTMGSLLRSVASTYLGIMGARAIINTSDMITSAQNRLNNIEGGSPELTAESMDKIYAAAQRSRSGYGAMLSNVSKTMTLAGDAFQGNIDNAIRFQEIMAKAYTIGGASAEEQASSMYQLVQALGSGILQGDELRSVREGAPLAYSAIEEFAQGVFNTEESLKDLASQGLITSDMIVAAIMDMENGTDNINDKFENTAMTFAQAWERIKNTAIKAFEPVLETLNEFLNSDAGQSILRGLEIAIVGLANAIQTLFDWFGAFFNWCADNWYWLQYVVWGVVGAIVSYLVYLTAVNVWAALKSAIAWMVAHGQMALILLTIGLLVAGIVWLANSTVRGSEFMVAALGFVALAILLIGIISGNTAIMIASLVIGILLLLAMVFLLWADKIIGAIYWIGALFQNVWWACCNYFIALWNWTGAAFSNIWAWIQNVFQGVINVIVTIFHNRIADIVNTAMALSNSVSAIAQNIGIAFSNAWNGALSTFWNFVAGCLEGIQCLEPAINALAEVFGKSGFSVSGLAADLRAKADSYGQQSYVSVSDAWNSGLNTRQYEMTVAEAWNSGYNSHSYQDAGAAWNSGMNTYDAFAEGWGMDAYHRGELVGAQIKGAVGGFADSLKGKISDISSLGIGQGFDKWLEDVIGIDLSGMPNPYDPSMVLGGAYDPGAISDDIANANDKLGNIDENTAGAKDALGLLDDDLEYLRKIAEMEWRNEFTTAEIKVDMTNNNMVNGERDLDGIVSYLSDVLKEEMTNVAYGVHI